MYDHECLLRRDDNRVRRAFRGPAGFACHGDDHHARRQGAKVSGVTVTNLGNVPAKTRDGERLRGIGFGRLGGYALVTKSIALNIKPGTRKTLKSPRRS
jgi:predicted chitinase